MYKKVSYEELLKLKSSFFDSLNAIIKKNRCPSFKDYLSLVAQQGDCVYHIVKQEVVWRTISNPRDKSVVLIDERERLELMLTSSELSKLNSLLGNTTKLKALQKSSVSIEDTLNQAFASGSFQSINDKPYLVYDIETSYSSEDILSAQFYMGYAYVVQAGKGSYRYIDSSNLAKFVEYLLDFEGYVIGYNSLAFDNPVCVAQALHHSDSFSPERYQERLARLNAKSLDLFQFVWGITGKRIGLNKLSRALIGLGKTLESGAQAQGLRERYEQGEEQALKTLKTYCKNDVKMTYLSLWYLLHFSSLSLENEEITFDLQEFLKLSNTLNKESDDKEVNTGSRSMFG